MNISPALLICGGLLFLWLDVTGVEMCKTHRRHADGEDHLGHGPRPGPVPTPTAAPVAATPATAMKEKRKGSGSFYPSSHPYWAIPITIGRRRRDAQ